MYLKFAIVALVTIYSSSFTAADETDCGTATTHDIRMLNKSETDPKMKMVFEPSFVEGAPGDCIRFIPTSKGHNAETIKGMFPKGFKKFKGKINKEFTVKLETDGLYGIKCTPHYQMGMVALIQIGQASEEQLKKAGKVKHRGKAKDRFKLLFERMN